MPLSNQSSQEHNIVDVEGYSYFNPHKHRNGLHWVAHAVCGCIILVLLYLQQSNDSRLWSVCWNMHSYYCKISKNVSPIGILY